jgi:hypothetical protein
LTKEARLKRKKLTMPKLVDKRSKRQNKKYIKNRRSNEIEKRLTRVWRIKRINQPKKKKNEWSQVTVAKRSKYQNEKIHR